MPGLKDSSEVVTKSQMIKTWLKILKDIFLTVPWQYNHHILYNFEYLCRNIFLLVHSFCVACSGISKSFLKTQGKTSGKATNFFWGIFKWATCYLSCSSLGVCVSFSWWCQTQTIVHHSWECSAHMDLFYFQKWASRLQVQGSGNLVCFFEVSYSTL